MRTPTPRIALRDDARETIASETSQHLPRETGGILLGYHEDGTVVVTHALAVSGTESSSDRYIRDDVLANAALGAFLAQRTADDPVGYVGEWHSHPAPCGPSSIDDASLRAIAKVSDRPIALLVYAPGGAQTFFGRTARRHRFGRITAQEAMVVLPPRKFEPLGPLPDRAVQGAGPVFISYRQSDGTAQADSLEDLLRAAGLVVWRDHTDLRGGTTIDRLEQALTTGLSAGVLVVTPEIADSDIVRERELPRLLHLDADPAFSLCIANRVARTDNGSKCDYGAPDRLLRLAPAPTLANKKQANMLDPSGSGEEEIVRDLLMHRIEQRKPAIRKEGRDFTIRVQSRPAPFAIDADDDDLHVRVKPAADGRLPSRVGLDLLKTTLPLTSDAVYAAGAPRVQVSGGAHLSIGLALGAALPDTKFGRVTVVDVRGDIWGSSTTGDTPLSSEVTVETIGVEPDSASGTNSRVAVFVSMTANPDRTAFARLVSEDAPRFAAAEIISVGGPSRVDPDEAAGLIEAVAQRIRQLSTAGGRSEVHLAFHGPFAAAVLLGRHLNTLRTVVYEWDGYHSGAPTYEPVMVLEPGVTKGPIVEVLA